MNDLMSEFKEEEMRLLEIIVVIKCSNELNYYFMYELVLILREKRGTSLFNIDSKIYDIHVHHMTSQYIHVHHDIYIRNILYTT